MLFFGFFVFLLNTKKVHSIFKNLLPKHLTHTPVLLDAILRELPLFPGATVVDATLGLGGHAREMLKKIGKTGRLFGFDWDARNREIAAKNLAEFPNVEIIPAPFSRIDAELFARGVEKVDAILFDFGISSAHLDDGDRGFSFRFSAPLDLRMNSEIQKTAADLCREASESELADFFFRYGEDRFSRKIAAEIKKNPPETTTDLFAIAEKFCRNPKKSAARLFQALRIAVNDELSEIEIALPKAAKMLRGGGRVAAISFHRLEDRLVKNIFRDFFFTQKGETRKWQRISKKPICPSADEIAQNPRARSAKLRILEKL